jgi:hypothetical protein
MSKPASRGKADIALNSASEADLLRILVAMSARTAFPRAELRKIVVGESRVPWRWIAAYNACDGTKSQTEIAALASVDVGDLSRALTRWIDEGVVFRVGPGRLPQGLYPLPSEKERDKAPFKAHDTDAAT